MAQLYRDQFAHYINTKTKTGETEAPTWTLEGTGIESLSVSFNPQKDSYKDITKRTTKTTFKNYELSSSVSGKRLFSEDAMYEYLNDLRINAIAGETQLLEINTAKQSGSVSGTYEAVKYDILITINEWLGEDATISYDIDYSNPVVGTATISGGTPTFTEASE